MGEELVKLDDIRDRLREKIKTAFMDLIPDEQWDAIVKKEVENLMSDKTEYGRVSSPSPLRKMVQDLILEEWKNRIQAWAETKPSAIAVEAGAVDTMFGNYIAEAAKAYQQAVGNAIVAQALEVFRTNLPSTLMTQMRVCCGRILPPGSNCPQCGTYVNF